MIARLRACNCSAGFFVVNWGFEPGSVPSHMTGEYEGCLGCDETLKEVIRISIREGDAAGNNRRGGGPPPGPGPGRGGGNQRGRKRKSDHDPAQAVLEEPLLIAAATSQQRNSRRAKKVRTKIATSTSVVTFQKYVTTSSGPMKYSQAVAVEMVRETRRKRRIIHEIMPAQALQRHQRGMFNAIVERAPFH